jgi:hypothetical protein
MYKVYVETSQKVIDLQDPEWQYSDLSLARLRACVDAVTMDRTAWIICDGRKVETWTPFEARVLYFQMEG